MGTFLPSCHSWACMMQVLGVSTVEGPKKPWMVQQMQEKVLKLQCSFQFGGEKRSRATFNRRRYSSKVLENLGRENFSAVERSKNSPKDRAGKKSLSQSMMFTGTCY